MYIYYRSKKIEELCTEFNKATVKLGRSVAKILFRRLAQIYACDNFKPIVAVGLFGCHKLTGNKKQCYGIDLDDKNRIVFEVRNPEETDLEKITEIIIREVGDYHD